MDSRFSDSNDFSNGSSTCCIANTYATATATTDHNHNNFLFPDAATVPDVAALRHLSDDFDSIFDSLDVFADARIAVSGGSGGGKREVAVHRCILSARSKFFRAKFRDREREKEKEKGRGGVVKFELKELARDFDVSIESLVAVLSYLYSGKVRPLPRDVCTCVDDECPHLACWPAVDFLVEVLYLSSTFQISELVALFQRHMLDILDKVSSDDILIVLHVANICGKGCSRLLDRCIEIVVHSNLDSITLEKSLPPEILKLITDLRKRDAISGPEGDKYPDKHVKRIHRALDSDDVELVGWLLKEAHTTLDDAYALHYAVAYCDAKTTTELLDLAIADVNRQNHRGYTVLHVSAMRREPKIIVSLLDKGARPTDQTSDGRKALQISKRLTKAVDWNRSTAQGQASPKDRLCIEILEQAERRYPLLRKAAVSLAIAGEALRIELEHLELRVGLAKLLFPMEAQLAMDIANVDSTSELPLAKDISRPQSAVDLNEVPFKLEEGSRQRMDALSRTVDLGKRYFPRCSRVLDQILEDDCLNDLATTGNESPQLQVMKKQKYSEFEELVNQAFTKDKEETDLPTLSSSSSSTSIMNPQARVALQW
ncbi:hypothetical protein Droror1_Dr00007195 [Drosera rotundifolia]